MPVATQPHVQTSTIELAFLAFIWDLVAWGEQGEEEPRRKRALCSRLRVKRRERTQIR